MAEGNKRKSGPPDGSNDHDARKKKRMGNGGKWQTPHQKSKSVLSHHDIPQPGDVGVWVTCARGQESRAVREVISIFEEYAEIVHGIKSDAVAEGDDEEPEDIEAAIKKEVAAINARKEAAADQVIQAAKMDISCLLFVKTRPPIEPVEFVRRICVDAKTCSDISKRKSRYLNRFTPIVFSGKATEQGLLEVAQSVLAPYFDLGGSQGKNEELGAPAAESSSSAGETEAKDGGQGGDDLTLTRAASQPKPPVLENIKPYTYAIRPTIRNHSTLDRDTVIKRIAGLINDQRHKVSLDSPDKVILIDIFKNVCGMSVVDGDWDEFKRFNLTELYKHASETSNS